MKAEPLIDSTGDLDLNGLEGETREAVQWALISGQHAEAIRALIGEVRHLRAELDAFEECEVQDHRGVRVYQRRHVVSPAVSLPPATPEKMPYRPRP